MTIGERLEEARKRRGISIREAAEATKVRGDYLLAMEENRMDKIPLPEIYKRGFLKNYARLVKLDPDKILTDYQAREIGRTSIEQESPVPHQIHIGQRHEPAAQESKASFGKIVLEEDDDEEPQPKRNVPPDTGSGIQKAPERHDSGPRHPALELIDNTLYLKIAAGIASFAILLLLIVVLVNLLRSSDPDVAVTPEPTRTTEQRSAPTETTQSARSLTIRASDTVTLIIDQVDPAERLFQGTLAAGDVIPVEKQGPVSIRFSNGAALVIEQPNGQTIRPSQSSIGRIVVP